MGNTTVTGSVPSYTLTVDGNMDFCTKINLQRYLNAKGPSHLQVNEDGDFGKQSKKELQRYLNWWFGCDLYDDGVMGTKSSTVWRTYLLCNAPSSDIEPSGDWDASDAVIALQLMLNEWKKETELPSTSSMNEEERTVHCLDNAVTKLKCFNYKGWLRQRRFIETQLQLYADHLSGVNNGTAVASIVTSSAGILSGLMIVGGIVLAPFTAGASVALTVGGIATGVTSGVAGLATSLSKFGIDKDAEKEMHGLTESHRSLTNKLFTLLKELANREAEMKALLQKSETSILRVGEITFKSIWQTWQTYSGVVSVRNFSYVASFLSKASSEILIEANTKNVIAGNVAASGGVGKLLSKIVEYGSFKQAPNAAKSVEAAFKMGSTGAKALSGALSIVGIGFSIWGVISASQDLNNGSDLAKKFLEAKESLADQRRKIQEQTSNGAFFELE